MGLTKVMSTQKNPKTQNTGFLLLRQAREARQVAQGPWNYVESVPSRKNGARPSPGVVSVQ